MKSSSELALRDDDWYDKPLLSGCDVQELHSHLKANRKSNWEIDDIRAYEKTMYQTPSR
jgi:hypothetical protein